MRPNARSGISNRRSRAHQGSSLLGPRASSGLGIPALGHRRSPPESYIGARVPYGYTWSISIIRGAMQAGTARTWSAHSPKRNSSCWTTRRMGAGLPGGWAPAYPAARLASGSLAAQAHDGRTRVSGDRQKARRTSRIGRGGIQRDAPRQCSRPPDQIPGGGRVVVATIWSWCCFQGTRE